MLYNKLIAAFDEMVVYKDLQKTNIFSALNLPSFMRDWLIKKFSDADGNLAIEEIQNFVHRFIPTTEEWQRIKSALMCDGERVKLFTKISVDFDILKGEVSFSLPEYSLKSKETTIENYVWNNCKEELLNGTETWGIVELGYRFPDSGPPKRDGKITLENFRNFRPYSVDVEYFKEARQDFTTEEWIDVVLGAIDYNPSGYKGEDATEMKLTMLTRILPFLEPRLNLVELAPKGTGKSYIYGKVSRYGWLIDSSNTSRAKLFYDIQKGVEGLISWNDYVVIDEVQTAKFGDEEEMRSILKSYLENGIFHVGGYEGKADAGLILSGNIEMTTMEKDGYGDMFRELPTFFHESALIDRFHGFIKGWNIPRMTHALKVCGWALNSEYFTTILHFLRRDTTYRAIVDELIDVPPDADQRDTEAIKRITTAYLKLLFPHVRKTNDITANDFKRYCFRRAKKMRSIIKYQLGILDPSEFGDKEIPELKLRDMLCKED